ncbi:MAG: DNA methyltransferase, partial [bacterium]
YLYLTRGYHSLHKLPYFANAFFGLTSIWRFPPERENSHPAPFPLALPVRCIFSVMDEKKDGLVIDPYCGSGTTLVAAKILEHNFIGIDISKEYVEFCEKRLKNYNREEKYANEEISKHVVIKTFKERKEKGEFTGKYGQQNNKKMEQQSLFKLFEEF